MEVLSQGYVFDVEITYYSEGEPAVTHLLPEDCHEGSEEEIEYDITDIAIDCMGTVIDTLGEFCHDTLTEAVLDKYKE